jgi:methionyl-tRNA synthetase
MGTSDSDFSDEKFIEVYNSDLANTVGNSLNRICNMTARYFDGKLPEPGTQAEDKPDLSDEILKHLDDNSAHQCTAEYLIAITGVQPDEAFRSRGKLSDLPSERFDLHHAIEQGLRLVRAIDYYIEQTAPFKLAKDESKKPIVGTILWNCAEAMRIASILLWPIMPGKCEEIWRRLGCDSYVDALAEKDGKPGTGDFIAWTQWGQLAPGTQIAKNDPLFPRYQVK